MKIRFGKNKLKVTALVLCAIITTGSMTCVNYGKPIKTEAKTIEDIEAEQAQNQKEIDKLQEQLDNIKGDIADQEKYQNQLQEKIDLQTQNIQNVNDIINNLNKKIEEKEDKIDQLEDDIATKQKDIEAGLELFKDRLRAMYISGNDSLASALVGSTDFYDMLSKIELISQVAKHDNELVDSLKTQLQQFEEAQAQLDIEKIELDSSLAEQQEYKSELNTAMTQLQEDYSETEDYISRQESEISSKQGDIATLESDNAKMDSEIQSINDEIARQQQAAAAAAAARQQEQSNSYSNDDDDDEDDDDYYSDDNNSSGNSDTSGDGEISGSSGGGSYGGSLSWPVPGFYTLSSGYGYRWGSLHAGVDVASGGISGATVTAAASGTVILVKTGCSHNYGKDSSCGCNGGYGNYVVIDHGDGMSTLYGHCAEVYASVGQSVSAGDAIGSVGSTGWSTGFHLHFEVRINGSTVDPSGYLY